MDFIVINGGGKEIGLDRINSSTLIPLEATPEQVALCSPPVDMPETKMGHMFEIANGSMVICAGSIFHAILVDSCFVYNMGLAIWEQGAATFNQIKSFFPYVRLDNSRIWNGRKFHNTKDFGWLTYTSVFLLIK